LENDKKALFLRIEWSQLVRIAAFILCLTLVYNLANLILLALLGMMIAVALNPILKFLTARKIPRAVSLFLITAGVIGVAVGFFVFLFPPLLEQLSELLRRLPELKATLLGYFPNDSGFRRIIAQAIPQDSQTTPTILAQLLFGISWAVQGFFQFVLCIAFAIYFLIDGPRAYLWITAFFSDDTKEKIDKTSNEAGKIIFAYVAGQALTSLLCAVYAFLILSYLKVPVALILAAFAAVFDVLPIVGFFLFTIPAVLMALTISIPTAYIVASAFFAYHLVENYFLVPKIYGDRMRVSGLVVMFALASGAVLAHIQGAIAILPIVASYPFIEKIWLTPFIGKRSVSKHKQLEQQPEG
jgi:predicted PurR-regulated permease PerM